MPQGGVGVNVRGSGVPSVAVNVGVPVSGGVSVLVRVMVGLRVAVRVKTGPLVFVVVGLLVFVAVGLLVLVEVGLTTRPSTDVCAEELAKTGAAACAETTTLPGSPRNASSSAAAKIVTRIRLRDIVSSKCRT